MRVGIVGLGLIGGSLGLALRRLGESIEVLGVAHHPNGVAAAQQRGAVDRASTNLRDLVDCEVVVVATPISQIRSEEHTSELQSRQYLVCRLLLEKKKQEKKQAAADYH